METVQLTKHFSATRLGFGGCPLGGHGWGSDFQVKEGMEAVRRAWDKGVRLFDTADVYGLGQSEERLSESLGSSRHQATIATKFGVRWDATGRTRKDLSLSYLRSALEASLRRLRLECIPLYYVHWPDQVTPIPEVIGELKRCQDEGKIQSIGVSNFSAMQLQQACCTARIAAAQFQCSLVDRQEIDSLMPIARANKVALVAWGALAQGLLTGKFDSQSNFEKNDRRYRYDNFKGEKFQANLRVVKRVQAVAGRLGVTPAQVAIRWLLDAKGIDVVLFGAKRLNQVDDNLGCIGWSLDQESFRALDDEKAVTDSALSVSDTHDVYAAR